MKAKFSTYAKHVVLCLAFLFLPYAFTATNTVFSLPDLYSNGHDRIYFFIYFTLLCFFYFNYYYLIPKFYFKDKKLLYYLLIIAFLLFFLWISTVLDHPATNFLDFNTHPQRFPDHFKPFPNDFRPPPRMRDPMSFDFNGGPPTQNRHTALIYLIGVISSLLFAISDRLQNVEKEKVKSELSFLKAQINPHFLFNTLNSIYALALKKDDKTPDAVVQLSELMRYIMTNSNDEEIDLTKEINYISNYISLQKTRLGNTVSIDYRVSGSTFGKVITPLILISFIENAFKHGVNPDQTSEICIYIEVFEDEISLFVSNKKTFSVQSDSGIGLQNTLERLTLLYPNKHKLAIDDSQDRYTVSLIVKIR